MGMNRRDLLKAIIAAPVVAAIPAEFAKAHNLSPSQLPKGQHKVFSHDGDSYIFSYDECRDLTSCRLTVNNKTGVHHTTSQMTGYQLDNPDPLIKTSRWAMDSYLSRL